MKQTNERLCALAQKGDAAALDSLIDNNKSFIGKVANDLFRSMNLAQSGLNLDTDDLKQAGNLGLWKTVPKFDAARGMKFLTYAAPAIRNAMMDMVRDAFAAFEQRMVTEDKDGICYQRVSLDDVLPGEEQLQRIEAIADPYAMHSRRPPPQHRPTSRSSGCRLGHQLASATGSVEKNESIFAEASAPTAIRHASPKLVEKSPIRIYGRFSKMSFLMFSCFFIVPAPSACSGPRRRVLPVL